MTISELLEEDKSFLKDLKDGNYCLVLGAGFSFGKDKDNRLKNKTNHPNPLYQNIPLTWEFIEITKLEFKEEPVDFPDAVTLWEEAIKKDEIKRELFRNLFLLDVADFNNRFFKIYKEIIIPNWYRIFTFNFDNVFETICRNDEYHPLSYPDDKEFTSNPKEVAHVHGRLEDNSDVTNLVFFGDKYAELQDSRNDLYYALLNSVDTKNQKKNLVILGCQFNERIQIQKFHKKVTSGLKPKIYQFDNKEPRISGGRKEFEYKYIKCSTFDFLKFISEHREEVAKVDFLPKFLEKLKISENCNENVPVKAFSDFLNNQHLKYYSRGKFKLTLHEQMKNEFQSENDILKFINEDKYNGLIVHGQGGIGKTRLMLELGNRLLIKHYIVIKVYTDFENLNELIDYVNLRPEKKYALLFDYIEEQKGFDKTAKWIINGNYHDVKIIGNCRNTFVSEIQNNYIDYFKFIDIGTKSKVGVINRLEQDYKRNVVLSIIKSISDNKFSETLRDDHVLKTFYQARPSFAAFLKYIHFKNPEFVLHIATNESFSNWLIKKLKLTIVKKINYPNFFENKKYLFSLLSCLPASQDSAIKLENIKIGEISFADEINKLKKDGWIDETEDKLRVVHDSVNDSLLIEFLKYFQFGDAYFNELLKLAVECDSISSMMYSIQRIWDDIPDKKKYLLQKNIANFIHINLNQNVSKEDWFKFRIDTTPLLAEDERIILFIKHKNLFKECFALEKFGHSLAFSLEWVHENISEETQKKYYADELKTLFFKEWNIEGRFNDFVKDVRGGKIISSYINLLGLDDYIKDRFWKYIGLVECSVSNLESLSLAIVSWLNEDGEITTKLKDLIYLWIEMYDKEQPKEVNPSYLMNSCFTRGLDVSLHYKFMKPNFNNLGYLRARLLEKLKEEPIISQEVRSLVADWFEIYENEMPEYITPFTLTIAWLQKGGDVSIIKKTISQLLNSPQIDVDTKAKCIGLYLENSNELELVEPFITKILREEIIPKTAYYIIGHWLEKGGCPILIKPFLSKWLNKEVEPQITSYIFQNWLEKGDEPDIIIEPLKKWITSSIYPESISYTINKFILANGNIFKIKKEIFKWLGSNYTNKDSVFFLGQLLENLTDKTFLADLEIPVQKVLKNFSSFKESGSIFSSWLENGGNLSTFDLKLNKWLKQFWNSAQGCSIMGSWLKRNGNPAEIKEFIIPCIEMFAKEKNIAFLMSMWTMNGDDPYLLKDLIKPFFETNENQVLYESRYLITTWLSKTNLPNLVKEAIKPWLANNGHELDSIRVCSFWLQKGDEIRLVEDYIKNSFFNFADIKDCHHVIENWIKKDGDLKLIEKCFEKYLNKDLEDINTIYIVTLWLSKNGPLEILNSYIKTKFLNYSYNKDSLYVIFLLLDNHVDFKLIKPSIIEYLKYNWEITNSTYLIKKCIGLNLICSEIEKYILKIIEKLGSNPFHDLIEIIGNRIIIKGEKKITSNPNLVLDESDKLSFKIKDHLKSGKSSSLVKKEVIEFLTKHGHEKDASYVLAAWIEYGNDFDLVKDFLIVWLEKNLLEEAPSSFVLASALELDKGFIAIHKQAIEWLNIFGKTYTAKYPISSWLKRSGNTGAIEIEQWIIYWVQNLYDPNKHYWRDDLLLNYVLTK